MAEVTFTAVIHDGEFYPEGTPLSKISNLTTKQKKELVDSGAAGTHEVPPAVQTELEEKQAEIDALKAQLAAAQETKGTPTK